MTHKQQKVFNLLKSQGKNVTLNDVPSGFVDFSSCPHSNPSYPWVVFTGSKLFVDGKQLPWSQFKKLASQ